jgi:hypothetical protein
LDGLEQFFVVSNVLMTKVIADQVNTHVNLRLIESGCNNLYDS